MPQNIGLAAFAFGALLLLLALSRGGFKLFGAEVSGASGPLPQLIAGFAGAILIGFGLWESTRNDAGHGPALSDGSTPAADARDSSPQHVVTPADMQSMGNGAVSADWRHWKGNMSLGNEIYEITVDFVDGDTTLIYAFKSINSKGDSIRFKKHPEPG